MNSSLRFKMVDAAINHTAVEVEAPKGRPSEYFGERVFGHDQMRRYLSKADYKALVENGVEVQREVYPSGGHGWTVDSFAYAKDIRNKLIEWVSNL